MIPQRSIAALRAAGATDAMVEALLADLRAVERERQARYRARSLSQDMSQDMSQDICHKTEKPREIKGGMSQDKSHSDSLTSLSKTQNKEERKKRFSDSQRKKVEATEAFEKFWTAYPKRDGHPNPKAPALAKFEVAVRNGAEAAAIIAGAEAYAAACRDNGTEGKFVCQAVTWLNQKRWNDYHVVTTPKTADEIYAELHPGWRPGLPTHEELLAKYARKTNGQDINSDSEIGRRPECDHQSDHAEMVYQGARIHFRPV